MKRIIILCLLISVNCNDCGPGNIYGCPSSKDVIIQFNPKINQLKSKISTLIKNTNDRIVSTKSLILKNIASSNNYTAQQLTNARSFLVKAKHEARQSSLPIQNCINVQGVQLSKVHAKSLTSCNSPSSFTQLTVVRNKLLKLDQAVIGLSNNCMLLNPLRSEMVNLRMCIEGKIKDLDLQMTLVQKEFEETAKEIVNYSVACILRESGEVRQRIGEVEGAVANCWNRQRFGF